MSILSFVFILGLLIFLHKLGHFLVGRLFDGVSRPLHLLLIEWLRGKPVRVKK